MYTVLLADDEESVLSILKNSIDWQELGVDTLLTAADGRTALEQFSQRTIDLLVTDIRMPGMDGIELIRRVRALQSETHCILLTAYGEFQYAQEAIRLGVDNYLLKPIARAEVEQTLRSVLDNIYQKRQNSSNLLRENMLRRWATGMIGAEELADRASVLGWNLYCAAYCVLAMKPLEGANLTGCRASVTALLQMQSQCDGFWDDKGRYILILCGQSIDKQSLSTQLAELAAYENLDGKVGMAFGTVVTQYEQLHISYQSACDTLETANFSSNQVVAAMESDTIGMDASLLMEEIRMLCYDLHKESREAGFQHLAEKMCRVNRGKEALARLSRSSIQVLVQEFPLHKGMPERVYALQENLEIPTAPQDERQALLTFLQQIYNIFAELFESYAPMVQHMIRYIRSGVLNGEGVSIKELATKAGVTPAYMGHLFKQETGVFFNDYLLGCRLQRSVILLRNPNRKIKDIAETIGFTSTSYFVKCFREYKGESPAKYRMAWSGNAGGNVP